VIVAFSRAGRPRSSSSAHRLLQHLGDDRLDDLLAQSGRADARLDQLARRPAGPEAFDLRPRCEAV